MEATAEGAQRPGIKLSPPVLALAFAYWCFFLQKEQQRFILFWVALFKMAEYFYFLPQDLEQYQEEDWWDVPTIKKALLTMAVFWSLAWLSSALPSNMSWLSDRYTFSRKTTRAHTER